MTRQAWKIHGLILASLWLTMSGPAIAAEWMYEALDARNLYSIGRRLDADGEIGKAIVAYEAAGGKAAASNGPSIRALNRLIEIYQSKGPYNSQTKAVATMEQAAFLGAGGALSQLAKMRSEANVLSPRASELVPLFAAAGEKDCNSCAILMAKLTRSGEAGAVSTRSAADWYRLAADRGSSEGVRKMAMIEILAGRDAAGLAWLAKLGKGAGEAALSIARDFLDPGGDLPANPTRAIAFFQRALAVDPQAAMRASGGFIALMDDAQRQKILASLRGPADRGDADAAFLVATLLVAGNPTSISDEAMDYYLTAVRTGRPQAVKAVLRLAGFLTSEDPRSARLLDGLEVAATKGSADAMLALANFYMVGSIAPRDLERGFSLYLKAAKSGVPEAQFRTGVAYAQGLGTPVDLVSARRWLTASNTQRYTPAATYLEALAHAEPAAATSN